MKVKRYMIGIFVLLTSGLLSGAQMIPDNVGQSSNGLPPALVNVGFAERYYGARNSYYRWKRRRAAKKFEVYMSKHDRQVHFDEHGNYIPPDDDPGKGNGGGKSGWVN